MKRVITLLLVALVLTGCAVSGTRIKEPVTFYYLRTQADTNAYDDYYAEGVIGSEKRESTGHRENLNYLLSIYFRGPLDPSLSSPFPMGCRILEMHQEDGHMTILLNPILAQNSDLEVTLACACLAKTCMELADTDTIHIESRDLEGKVLFSRTFTQDNLFLNDGYTEPPEATQNT